MTQPRACIERNRTRKTIYFCRTPINLTQIADVTGLNLSFLSNVFNGKRTPSIKTGQLISHALGMSLDDFLKGLDARLRDKDARFRRQIAG